MRIGRLSVKAMPMMRKGASVILIFKQLVCHVLVETLGREEGAA